MRKKSLIASVAIFCSRFTGLLREVTFTAFFGASGALDAFLTAFRIPNLLRDMFGEGALSQSFTSEMSKVDKAQDRQHAWQLANMVSTQLTTLMLIIVGIGMLSVGTVMQYLYPESVALVLRVDETAESAPVKIDSTDGPEINALPEGSVKARFAGFELGHDGEKLAQFDVPTLPADWSKQSCIDENALSAYAVGDCLSLSAKSLGGEIAVHERNFMEMAAQLCRIMWPFILFAALSALALGALNVCGLFGLPNLVTGAFNLTLITVGIALGWWIDPNFGPRSLYGFAIGVLVGGVVQVFCLLPLLKKQGFKPKWNLGLIWQKSTLCFTHPSAKKVWILMLPGLIAAGITQANIFINTAFALYLPSGSVTALSCAFRISQLPVALFGVALGMVVLPDVSRMTLDSSVRGRLAISMHLAKAIRFLSFFALPCAVFLGVWGEEIISVCFQRGRFDAEAAAYTGQVLSAFSFGLFSYAGSKVLQPIFLALERPWPPAILAVFCCVISISLNYLFVHHFHGTAAWLASTTATVTTLNFLFYFFYLRHLLGGMALHVLIPGLVRIAVAGLLLMALCWGLKSFFMQNFTAWNFVDRFAMMAVMGLFAGLVYVIVSYVIQVPELDSLREWLDRKRQSKQLK